MFQSRSYQTLLHRMDILDTWKFITVTVTHTRHGADEIGCSKCEESQHGASPMDCKEMETKSNRSKDHWSLRNTHSSEWEGLWGPELGLCLWELPGGPGLGGGAWQHNLEDDRRWQYNARGHHHHPTTFNHEGMMWQKSAFSKNVSGWSPLPIQQKKLPGGQQQ